MNQPERLPDLPVYSAQPLPKPIREDAFSKPGTVGKAAAKSKGWAPAKGTKFRSTAEKPGPGRPRKRKRDPRSVTFY